MVVMVFFFFNLLLINFCPSSPHPSCQLTLPTKKAPVLLTHLISMTAKQQRNFLIKEKPDCKEFNTTLDYLDLSEELFFFLMRGASRLPFEYLSPSDVLIQSVFLCWSNYKTCHMHSFPGSPNFVLHIFSLFLFICWVFCLLVRFL